MSDLSPLSGANRTLSRHRRIGLWCETDPPWCAILSQWSSDALH